MQISLPPSCSTLNHFNNAIIENVNFNAQLLYLDGYSHRRCRLMSLLRVLSCTGQQSSHMNGGSSMPTIHIPQSGAPIVRPAVPSQQQQQLLQQQQKGTVRELLSNQGKLAGDKHFDSNNRQQTTVAALLEQRGQDRLVESGLKNSSF